MIYYDRYLVSVVERLEPTLKSIASVADLVPGEAPKLVTDAEPELKKPKRVLRVNLEDALLPAMHARPGTELKFSKVPENPYPEGATASEVTRYSIDSSYVLQHMLQKWDRPEQLLGELQFAFLCFLVGQVYSAFEQWKKLVHIYCSADEFLLKNPELFIDFIGVLYHQVFI